MSAKTANELPPGDPNGAQVNGPISSLNEAWFQTLDTCVVNFPLSDVILPTDAHLLCRWGDPPCSPIAKGSRPSAVA